MESPDFSALVEYGESTLIKGGHVYDIEVLFQYHHIANWSCLARAVLEKAAIVRLYALGRLRSWSLCVIVCLFVLYNFCFLRTACGDRVALLEYGAE